MFGLKIKSLRKSEWVLVWIGPITAATGLWRMVTESELAFALFIASGFIACVTSLWHAVDKDVELSE